MPEVHGVVGLVLYSGLLVHCMRQVVLIKATTPQSEQSALFLQLKLYFHAIFALNCFLEMLYSISLVVYNDIVQWGYSLHLVGLYCGILCFLLVIRLWNHVLFSQRLLRVSSEPYIAFLGVNLVSMLVDLTVYNMFGDSEMTRAVKVLAVLANIVYVLSLFLASCVLLWLGHDLKNKLTASPAGISATLRLLLRKINISLLLISACYGVRILGVGYITFLTVRDGHSPELGQRDYLLWVLFSLWIPFVGTSLLFLHVMHHKPTMSVNSTLLASSSVTTSSSTSAAVSSHSSDDSAAPATRFMSLSVDEGYLDMRPLVDSLRLDQPPISPAMHALARNRMDFFSSDSAVTSPDDDI